MWVKGKVHPIWDDSYKNFPYKKKPLNLKGIDPNLGGKLYDMSNPLPGWVYNIGLHLNHPGYAFYRMDKGDKIPTHHDHYETYCKIYNQKKENIRRMIVFLEDWVPGHVFEIGGTVVENYKAGDYISWTHDEPHSVKNESDIPRYTLQVTGV